MVLGRSEKKGKGREHRGHGNDGGGWMERMKVRNDVNWLEERRDGGATYWGNKWNHKSAQY